MTHALCLMLALLALPAAASPRDGQHDFDFGLGTFKSRVRRLKAPLTGSTTWVEGTGTVSVRKVMGGRGNLEEIELDMPSLHVEGLTLRLYHPASRQWSLHWANASSGVLASPPAVGEFKDGRGEFFDQETWDGKVILVRQVYSDCKPDSYHFEQAFSADLGKTWEANWIADVTRAPVAPLPLAEDRNREFDFNSGSWKAHVTRLKEGKWHDYDGVTEVTPVWAGRASLLELRAEGPAGVVEGAGLRLYDPRARQWSLNWANSSDGELGPPTVGRFSGERGEFVDLEPLGGRQIFVRHSWSGMSPKGSRFEQAFSSDGKSWDTNWVMTLAR